MTGKVFLTGSTGFLGSKLSSVLKFSGLDVFDLPRTYSLMREHELIDIFKQGAPGSALIHTAASGVRHVTSFEDCAKVNINATNCLLSAAVDSGINHIIVCGTCYEYGKTGNSVERLKVFDPLDPIGNYAITKACSFLHMKSLYAEQSTNISYLRIFQMFGESESAPRLYPALCKAAILGNDFGMSEGSQLRDFVHVDDVCTCILSILGKRKGWEVMNISTGIATSVYEFACFHWERLQAKGRLIKGVIPQKASEMTRLVGEPSDFSRELLRPFNLFPYL